MNTTYEIKRSVNNKTVFIRRSYNIHNDFFILEETEIMDINKKVVYSEINYLNLKEYTTRINNMIRQGAIPA